MIEQDHEPALSPKAQRSSEEGSDTLVSSQTCASLTVPRIGAATSLEVAACTATTKSMLGAMRHLENLSIGARGLGIHASALNESVRQAVTTKSALGAMRHLENLGIGARGLGIHASALNKLPRHAATTKSAHGAIRRFENLGITTAALGLGGSALADVARLNNLAKFALAVTPSVAPGISFPDVDAPPATGEPPPWENDLRPDLERFSLEFVRRWEGALFALNPRNPDAARHFCTSVREIFVELLETRAPNDAVLSWDGDCERTQQGTPSRKAKLEYLIFHSNLTEVQDDDVRNILELFIIFNSGTHGSAGKYTLQYLLEIRERVEAAFRFLLRTLH